MNELVSNATNFRTMADQIDRNAASTFGGAAVIVAPGGLVPPIELHMLNSDDPALFLSTVLTRIQTILKDLEDRARVQGGFGR